MNFRPAFAARLVSTKSSSAIHHEGQEKNLHELKSFKHELHPVNKIPKCLLLLCNVCLFETTPLSCYFPCFMLDLFELNQGNLFLQAKEEHKKWIWLARTIAGMYNVGDLYRFASRGWEHLSCSVSGNHAETPDNYHGLTQPWHWVILFQAAVSTFDLPSLNCPCVVL